MPHDVISTCPVCAGELAVTRLHCRSCGTTLEGEFSVGRFGRLTREQLVLLESFLRSRGNLRDMERELGISYPTVRSPRRGARPGARLRAARRRREPARGRRRPRRRRGRRRRARQADPRAPRATRDRRRRGRDRDPIPREDRSMTNDRPTTAHGPRAPDRPARPLHAPAGLGRGHDPRRRGRHASASARWTTRALARAVHHRDRRGLPRDPPDREASASGIFGSRQGRAELEIEVPHGATVSIETAERRHRGRAT